MPISTKINESYTGTYAATIKLGKRERLIQHTFRNVCFMVMQEKDENTNVPGSIILHM